jgi:hypothetical protein
MIQNSADDNERWGARRPPILSPPILPVDLLVTWLSDASSIVLMMVSNHPFDILVGRPVFFVVCCSSCSTCLETVFSVGWEDGFLNFAF